MAIDKEFWDKAKAMFEGGADIKLIAYKTGIERTTISKKAKQQGWQKSLNATIIDNEINLLCDKSHLNPAEREFHNSEVARKAKFLRELDDFSGKTMAKAIELMDSVDSGVNFKAVVEGVDKHSVTLGVNQRHANAMNVQQNTQNVSEVVFTRARVG